MEIEFKEYRPETHTKADNKERANVLKTYLDKNIFYLKAISKSISRSMIFSQEEYDKMRIYMKVAEIKTKMNLEDIDACSAIYKTRVNNPEAKICVLNFASFKNPGGGFLNGASGQEESLCHNSILYGVLRAFTIPYYDNNNSMLNRGLYTNRALYSPNVIFNNNISVDVLTVSSPNKSILKYNRNAFSENENNRVFEDRLNFIKRILEFEEVDIAILGAFGCGAFKQNPLFVAQAMKDTFKSSSRIKEVLFAVPSISDSDSYFKKTFTNNYNVFKNVLEV